MKIIFCIALFYFTTISIYAQNELENSQENVKDSTQININPTFFDKVMDLIEFSNEASMQNDSTRFRSKFVLSPVLVYKPATSFGFGVGGTWTFRLKDTNYKTRTSNMPISAIYTLKNQILISISSTIFTNNENYMIKGTIEYFKFPQFYYGIGNNTLRADEEQIQYQKFVFEPLLFRRIVGKFFLGAGLRYRNTWDLDYKKDGILDTQKPIGYKGSVSTGVQIAATFDSRDNLLNAAKGSLFEIRHAFYGTQLKSIPFQSTKIDLRSYFKLSQRNDVLAMQIYGYLSDKRTPFAELAVFGGDQLMRGYYQGRFLDNNMIAGQAEYRFRVYKPIGMVVFGSAGQVYNSKSEINLQNLKLDYGIGLRLKIVKSENLNARFDIAKGENINFYFGIAEAF